MYVQVGLCNFFISGNGHPCGNLVGLIKLNLEWICYSLCDIHMIYVLLILLGVSNGMRMMMDNTRTGTQRFQQVQTNRTSSIGPTTRYELQ